MHKWCIYLFNSTFNETFFKKENGKIYYIYFKEVYGLCYYQTCLLDHLSSLLTVTHQLIQLTSLNTTVYTQRCFLVDVVKTWAGLYRALLHYGSFSMMSSVFGYTDLSISCRTRGSSKFSTSMVKVIGFEYNRVNTPTGTYVYNTLKENWRKVNKKARKQDYSIIYIPNDITVQRIPFDKYTRAVCDYLYCILVSINPVI